MTITEHDRRSKLVPPQFQPAWIGLNYANREDLYRRIDARVDEMIAAGLEQELDRLLEAGVPESATSMQAIGYKELLGQRRGEVSRAQAIEDIKRGSRNYAKRQLTWLRRNPEVHWISLGAEPDFETVYQQAAEILIDAGFPGAEDVFPARPDPVQPTD